MWMMTMLGRLIRSRGLPLAVIILLASFWGLAPGLSAQESSTRVYRKGYAWVEETEGRLSVQEGQHLRLRSEFGCVVVHSGPAGEVRYAVRKFAYHPGEAEARAMFRQFSVSVRQTSAQIYLAGETQAVQQGRYARRFAVEYEVTVPAGFGADVETQAGDIDVDGSLAWLRAVSAGGNIRTGDINSKTVVETMGGNIKLGNIGGPLQAETAGGDIRVGAVRGSARLETSGGTILAGRVEGDVQATTAGGDIRIAGAAGNVVAQTAGGRIVLGEVGGRVQAETAGGSIRVLEAVGVVEAQTAGGEIELQRIRDGVRAATAAGNIVAHILSEHQLAAESLLTTSFGDVVVYIPPEMAVTIDAVIEMAVGHKIQTEFPLTIEGASTEYFPVANRVRGFGELNGGGEVLKIRTVGGTIAIRKLTQEVLEGVTEGQEKQRKLWERLWQRRKAKPEPEPNPNPPR